MLRIGNILIDPDSVDTIVGTNINYAAHNKVETIQIIYKNGVVKNFSLQEIGMSYEDFINEFERVVNKAEDHKMLKVMAAINGAK